jgi:hypothetical protein
MYGWRLVRSKFAHNVGWIRIIDSDYPLAETNSAFIDQLESQNGGTGMLLKAKLLVQCDYSGREKNGISAFVIHVCLLLDDILTHVDPDTVEIHSVAYLENQMLSSLALDSQLEYLQWIQSYVAKVC